LLAGLLLFRLLYYLVPFFLALVILGAREIWLSARRVRSEMQSDTAIPAKVTARQIGKNECDPAA
jgi:hypothetical protein